MTKNELERFLDKFTDDTEILIVDDNGHRYPIVKLGYERESLKTGTVLIYPSTLREQNEKG